MNNADWHFLLAPGHDHHNHKGTPALLPPLPHTPSGGVEARGKFDALQPHGAAADPVPSGRRDMYYTS